MLTLERNPEILSAPWWVPYSPNPFFTGRAKVLQDLRTSLLDHHAVVLTEAPVFGRCGGMGKTQTAVAYAYRNRREYTAVLWARANSEWILKTDLLAIARLLGLAGNDGRNLDEAVLAVKAWLDGNLEWLFVLDNADDPAVVNALFQPVSHGQILLTSRTASWNTWGISESVQLGPMLPEEAMNFLFKRTGRLKSDPAERFAAMTLAQELGNFPVALEQAGAYLAATHRTFREYLHELSPQLKPSRDPSAPALPGNTRTKGNGCPASVISTWALSVDEIDKESASSADLLRVSAFLFPDRIPLDLLVKGAPALGPNLEKLVSPRTGDGADIPSPRLDAALDILARFGLISWDLDHQSFSLTPLAQEAAKRGMDDLTKREWAERAVRALHRALPPPEEDNSLFLEMMLQQALAVAGIGQEWHCDFLEAGQLVHRLGQWLRAYRSYAAAEVRLKQALEIYVRVMGNTSPEFAMGLRDLAMLYLAQDNFQEAEPLLKKALAVAQKAHPPDHPVQAMFLTSLARCHHAVGRYAEAEPLYREALTIRKRGLSSDHPDLAAGLNNAAALYFDLRRFEEAAPLLEQALAIARKTLPQDHPDLAICLLNLAALYYGLKQYERAEPHYREAVAIREQRWSEDPLGLVDSLEYYGRVLRKLGRGREAAPWEAQAKAIRAAHVKKTGKA